MQGGHLEQIKEEIFQYKDIATKEEKLKLIAVLKHEINLLESQVKK